MVNWEVEYLKKEETQTNNSGTLYIDLPKNEQIGMLMVEIRGSHSAAELLGSILNVATKVEVLLNGSKVAYSAIPEIGSYFYYLASGRLPNHLIKDRGNDYMRLPILFGSKYRDEEYLLDTGKYKSAQLQIPYSYSTTYYTTATMQVTVWYERPKETLTPEGFIRQRVVKSESRSNTAGEFQHDLPCDYPVLDIGFRAYDINAWLENVMTDVKLDINSGRDVVFDGRIEDLEQLQELLFGICEGYHMWRYCTSADVIRSYMGFGAYHMPHYFTRSAACSVVQSSLIHGPQITITMYTGAGAIETADKDIQIKLDGLAPHSCFTVLHNPIENPYPLNEKDEAKLVFTQGAYAQDVDSFLREVVKDVLA